MEELNAALTGDSENIDKITLKQSSSSSSSSTSSSEIDSGNQCCFLFFDSLAPYHKSKIIIENLKNYLAREYASKKMKDKPYPKLPLPPLPRGRTSSPPGFPSWTSARFIDMRKNIPKQSDSTSCGVYVIKYVMMLLEKLPTSTEVDFDNSFSDYFDKSEFDECEIASERENIRKLLDGLISDWTEKNRDRKKVEEDLKEKRRLQKETKRKMDSTLDEEDVETKVESLTKECEVVNTSLVLKVRTDNQRDKHSCVGMGLVEEIEVPTITIQPSSNLSLQSSSSSTAGSSKLPSSDNSSLNSLFPMSSSSSSSSSSSLSLSSSTSSSSSSSSFSLSPALRTDTSLKIIPKIKKRSAAGSLADVFQPLASSSK